MLYIKKGQSNAIITDSVVDYIPSALQIKIDDVLIGTFNNESNTSIYIIVTISGTSIENINTGEHLISFIYYDEIIKTELIKVIDLNLIEPVKTFNNNSVTTIVYDK